MTTAHEALRALLSGCGVADDGASVSFLGHDPILPTRFLIGTATAAGIAAVGVVANQLWMLRGGREQRLELDVAGVAATLRGEHYHTRDGAPAPGIWHDISGFYATKDERWVQLHCNHPHLREGMLGLLGVAENREAVAAAVGSWSAFDLEEAVVEANLCAAAIRSQAEWTTHPHARAVSELPLIEVTRVSDTEPEHLSPAERPLSGIRALDLTHVIAGPVCGRTLAEHGAEVMRIGAPRGYYNESFVIDTGHGKLSARLDLRAASDRERLLSLAREADVFIQGFRPGALAQLGLAPEDLWSVRPGLIYVTLSAFGHAGPWAKRRGFDSLLQSTSGIAHEGGDGMTPKHLPAQAFDYATGYLAAFGALVALERRAREGGSYLVRVSLAQTGRWIQSLGRADPDEVALPGLPAREDLQSWMSDSETAFGSIRHVAPVLRMSETQPYWARPTAPFGAHPPSWPS